MAKRYDIVVKKTAYSEYRVVSVPNKELRDFNKRGDTYTDNCFSNNQYGKFLDGYRVKVI